MESTQQVSCWVDLCYTSAMRYGNSLTRIIVVHNGARRFFRLGLDHTMPKLLSSVLSVRPNSKPGGSIKSCVIVRSDPTSGSRTVTTLVK